MTLELVIFDCDGILVDSEPLSNQLFVDALAELGLSITIEECVHTFVGRSPKTNLETIERMLGRPLPADFLSTLMVKTTEHFARHLKPVIGIEAVLDRIIYPICVASSSWPEVIRTNLALTGLLPKFGNNIFSASQVACGKPAPDIFLFAARSMGAKAERCVVIEDSLAGVQAGRAAGMRVLAYTGTFAQEALAEAGAHTVFDDMSKLPELLN